MDFARFVIVRWRRVGRGISFSSVCSTLQMSSDGRGRDSGGSGGGNGVDEGGGGEREVLRSFDIDSVVSGKSVVDSWID